MGMTKTFGMAMLLVLPLAVWAAEPAAGIYGTEGGWGTMQIDARRLHIDAIGVNGHSCTVDASRQDSTWQTEALADTACRLSFKSLGQGRWQVTGQPMEACQGFCGARASFQGDYVTLPPGCTPRRQRQRHEEALSLYRAQRYEPAGEAMAALAGECAAYLDWREKNSLANDQAVTAWHLGELPECRRLSASVINEDLLEQLRQVAPTDYEGYKRQVDAARFNLGRCGG
jgi:hypothetical protein